MVHWIPPLISKRLTDDEIKTLSIKAGEVFMLNFIKEICDEFELDNETVIIEDRLLQLIRLLHERNAISRQQVVEVVRKRIHTIGKNIYTKNLNAQRNDSFKIQSIQALGYAIDRCDNKEELWKLKKDYPEYHYYIEKSRGIIEKVTNQLLGQKYD